MYSRSTLLVLLILGSVAVLDTPQLSAAGPRVFPKGQLPNDRRLGPQKDLNAYFPFKVPATRAAWEVRAAQLRQRIRVATGMWPMPERTPLNPVIHGKVQRKGFTVEKVYFQSYPGHFVTGLLFRPQDKPGRRAAVLCPHGHGGRTQDYGADRMADLIKRGAERFEASGRFPKYARCAQLARMGCVVFIFDMLGYVDSVQISKELAHRFKTQRPEMNTPKTWGIFSTHAELRMQSIMGIQTWNSIRALDFLASLPDVDQSRLGVTGGSGGGTQTILLGAIDERPVVAFPQGMVSTSMQGGCTCENCCLLRVGTGNVELAGLFAPRPQGMTTANDWTKEMMTKGFPELQKLYNLYGVQDNVMCRQLNHFKHNYNYVTRALMYSLFNKHLKLGLKEPIIEEDYKPLTPQEWTVWNAEHPRPKGGIEYEQSLTKLIDEASNLHMARLQSTDKASLKKYRHIIGSAFATIIGRGLPQAKQIEREKVTEKDRGEYLEFTDILRVKKDGAELPVVSFFPKSKPWNQQVVIWIDGEGKDGLYRDDGALRPEISKLLNEGTSVLSADLIYQGEFLATGKPLTVTPKVKNTREYAGFTFGYNHTVFALRVHDILTLVAFAANDGHGAEKVHLVGVNGAGPLVAAAKAISGKVIDRTAVDTQGFRFRNLKTYRDINFLPGVVKYGDIPGLLSLAAPGRLWIAGESGTIPMSVHVAYKSAGRLKMVSSFAGKEQDVAQAAVDWLSKSGDH